MYPNMFLNHPQNEANLSRHARSCSHQPRKLSQESNDAIWEELINSPSQTTMPLINLEPKQASHCSLDFDIHISEPNLVKLQEQDQPCKPLSDHLVKSDFSVLPRGSRPAKLSKDARYSPSSSARKNELHALRLTESRSESINSEELVKQQLVGAQSFSEEAANVVIVSSRRSDCNNDRDVPDEHQLRQTKSKSRFVEPRDDTHPQTSTKPSSNRFSNRAEDNIEEDPFKDIDYPDKFRQGNCKCITLVQWAAFFIIIASLACSLTVPIVEHRMIWGLELWKWFLLALVVLCGRLVSGWIIRLIVMIFEKNFLMRKRVLYFVYGLRKAVQNCLWLGLVLFAWKLMFDPKVERSTKSHKALSVVTKSLESFLMAAGIWLFKILLVKVLASSFHVSTFFDRIQDSLFNQHVLNVLSGPPLLSMGTATQGGGNGLINVQEVQKLEPKDVSAGLMKGLINLFAHPGILVTTIDESFHSEETPKEIEINNEMQAKAAAKRIFDNVARGDSCFIVKDDLLRFMHPEEVDRVILSFEGAKDTEKITKKALKNWVVKVYQDRKSLAHSLDDTKTAVDELHRVASVIVGIIIMIVWLLVFEIATTHVLLFITSQLLLAGFMFGNTVKQVFEAIVFLFVMHPYDVGDRCVIDGTVLMVEEMNILSTVFLRLDNEKVYYPNAVLATKPISNLYRSPVMKDTLDFSVHISTSSDKIAGLKTKIKGYVESHSEQWHPKFSVLVKELEDLNRMRLSIIVQHTINFQNIADRNSRRSDLLLELRKFFQDLGIEYRLLPQPIYLTVPAPAPAIPAAPGTLYNNAPHYGV